MSWTLCTSGTAIIKAGVNVNSDIVNYGTNQTALDAFSDQAEGSMEADTGMTLITSFAGLAAGIQGAIADVCSSKVALKLISYDSTGYLAREADTLMNMNDDIVTKGLVKLRDFKKMTLNSPT